MTQTAKNNLVNIQISRVASVDKAANRRVWALIKREAPVLDPPTPPTNPPPVDPPSTPKGDTVTKTADTQKPSLEGMTDAQKAYVETLEKRSEPAPVVVHTDDENYEEQIMKMEGISEPVKKQMIGMEKRAREGERIAKAERDARRKSEHVAVAKSEFSHLSKSADSLGGLMMRLEDNLAEADYKEVKTLLKAANTQLEKGDLFVEHGDGGDSTSGSASEQIEKAAVELRKADPKLSMANARQQAANADPELKKRWQAESRPS